MLTYTERSFMGHYRSADPVNLIPKILDKCNHALLSLFSPEDTRDDKVEGQRQITEHNAYNIHGLTKAVLWVAISISMALLIGRLS